MKAEKKHINVLNFLERNLSLRDQRDPVRHCCVRCRCAVPNPYLV